MDPIITNQDISDERFWKHLTTKDLMVHVGEGRFNLRHDTQTMKKPPFEEQLNLVLNFDDPQTGPMWCWIIIKGKALDEDENLAGQLPDNNPLLALLASEIVGPVVHNLHLSLKKREVLTGKLLTVDLYGNDNHWTLGAGRHQPHI